MQTVQLKSLLIKLMLGCVIAAAAVAVVAILAGSAGELVWKSITTIFSALIHILILFGILSLSTSTNPLTEKSSNFAINSSLAIIVASFFTSIFSTWNLLDVETTSKLYFTYVILLVSVLHIKTLMDVEVVYQKVRAYIYANYFLILLVAALLLGLIYAPSNLNLLEGFYGRLLAASAVVDVTLSIVVAVIYRLYLQKHPELREQLSPKNGHANPVLRVFVGLLILFFFVFPLIGYIFSFVVASRF